MLGSFADIPIEISDRVRGGECVVLIVLDGFGLEFLERHRSHPLVQRLEVTPVRSQFPSTTTSRVTTMHFGMPVEQHGLYEWTILEPSLGEIICPLRWAIAGAEDEGGLAGRLPASVLSPGPTLYETLDVACAVFQPREIARSHFTRMAGRGAAIHAFDRLEEGIRAVLASNSARYTLLYWDAIDRAGHHHGPSSAEFEAASRAALDALWMALSGVDRELTILITADHGHVDVSPERVDYLDELWPGLTALLSNPRPAGSSRDAFLHVGGEHVAAVLDGLSARLGDRARVCRAAELFGVIGPRLEERLGDVAVLPGDGRQVWMRGAAANEQWFRGQHGGLAPAETSTYLARFAA